MGTAFLIVHERVAAGERPPSRFLFEEAAGLAVVDLLIEDGNVVGPSCLRRSRSRAARQLTRFKPPPASA